MSTTSATTAPDGLPAPRRHLAVAVLLMAIMLVVLDGAIANIALPSIAASLGTDASSTVWVVSSYQLAVLVALLPSGALGEIYGPRRVFIIGVIVFTAASAACTFATSLPVLALSRFVQGLGGGVISALVVMNLRHVVPQRSLARILGYNSMTVAIAAASGPAIAGAILSVASWKWLFAVNVPLGIIALLCGRALSQTPGVKRPLSTAALLANTLMFILFLLGAERIASAPIFGVVMIAGALVSLLALLRIERQTPAPIVPLDLFAAPAFRVAIMASISCFAGQMLSYIALPFYLQHILGMPPVLAGLYMMPWPAATVVMAPLASRLVDRFKTAWLCAAGGLMMSSGVLTIALATPDPKAIQFLIGAVLAGAGFGLFQTPNNVTLLLSAPKARSGAAGAMQGTARLLGQTTGAILMAIIFATVPLSRAPHIALMLAGMITALSAMISFSRVRFETVK